MTDYGPLTRDDLHYIRSQFATLDALCAGRSEQPSAVRLLIRDRALPAATYVLDDGTEMFPLDYFALVDDAGGPGKLRAHFYARYMSVAAGASESEITEEWDGYLSGLYGACLLRVSPETIHEKESLVKSLGAVLAEPRVDDVDWRVCGAMSCGSTSSNASSPRATASVSVAASLATV